METKYKIHKDDDTCDCGRCEPAVMPYVTIGAVLSGNLGCDYPNCLILGDICRWGEKSCLDT